MNNQTIDGRKIQLVIALFLIGSSLIGGTSAAANQDSWIAIIIATAASILMTLVFCAILRLYPGENLYQIIINIFGSVVGKIICGIYVFFALHLGSLVLNIFSEFINSVNLNNTPKIAISWFMIIPVFFLVKRGISVLGSLAKFLYPALFVMVVITIILAIKDMHLDNIQPILNTDTRKLLDSSFSVFALPFGEIILLPTIFSIDSKENYPKIYIGGILFAFVVLVSANLRNLLILGTYNIKLFPFASYEAISVISIGEFLTRMEVIIGINLLLAGFFKIAVCCFSSTIGLAKILNVADYQSLATVGPVVMVTLTNFLFKNTVDTFAYIEIYKYYVLPYEVILPVIILITGLIKKRLSSGTQSPDELQ